MKLLRLILVLLLTLALPFAGAAAVDVPLSSPCPMQSDMSHTMVMPAGHDCCQMGTDGDAAGPSSKAKSSSPCKFGQDCKLAQVYSPALASVAFQTLPATPVIAVHPDSVMSSHDPSGLWRPPQL